MRIRLPTTDDEDAVVDLVRENVDEFLPHLEFSERRMRETFRRGMGEADPTLFLADDDGDLVGFLLAVILDYAFCDGIFVAQEVIYVRPDKRGSRAAAKLVQAFVQWGDGLGAKEHHFGISNFFQPDRTARFFEHFGARPAGYFLKRIGGWDGQP